MVDDPEHPALLVAEDLLPLMGAPRQARRTVAEACFMWEVPHLVGPATSIVSELVSNVVDHAHTMMRLEIRLQSAHLYIGVYDGSTVPPRIGHVIDNTTDRGRGLHIVRATATRWGHVARDGGKVVWAILAR